MLLPILLLLALHTTSSAFAPPPPPPHDSRRSRCIPSYQNNAGHGIQHITQQYPHQTRPSTQLKSADAPFYVGRNLAVAGRIPWKKLLINKSQAKEILSIMRAETHNSYFRCSYDSYLFIISREDWQTVLIGNRFRAATNMKKLEYEDSITFHVTETISEASRIAAVCYFIDTIEVALEVTGIKPRGKNVVDVSNLIAKLLYTTWAAFRVRIYKRGFFQAIVDKTPKSRGRGKHGIVEIFDKISDFFLFVILGLVWVDILNIKRGAGLSSIFALGGAGTFALTLAAQDIVKRMLNGVALAASDAFSVGDSILLGDGTAGTVLYMGWLNTEIRGFDEVITRIPNTQLSDIRVSNRSRMKFSQVKQRLRFKYEDLDLIPELCNDIRDEIAASCPKVVTDGSRTFRVAWTDYSDDHVEVVVDCRLRNKPTGTLYYEARQSILEAIAQAVKKKRVEFAPPTIRKTTK